MISGESGEELRDFHLLCEKFTISIESHMARAQITRVKAWAVVNAEAGDRRS